MAYVFKLPLTVTEEIMRYAIGYPSDRTKDMMADVVRTEIHILTRPRSDRITWDGPGRGDNLFEDWLCIDNVIFNLPLRGGHMIIHEWTFLGVYKERNMDLLQQQCEACEPAELTLQRTHF